MLEFYFNSTCTVELLLLDYVHIELSDEYKLIVTKTHLLMILVMLKCFLWKCFNYRHYVTKLPTGLCFSSAVAAYEITCIYPLHAKLSNSVKISNFLFFDSSKFIKCFSLLKSLHTVSYFHIWQKVVKITWFITNQIQVSKFKMC